MKNLETDLFKGDCYHIDVYCAIFENCKMLVDFGPVKKDSIWNRINISFQENRVIEFINANGILEYTVPYKLTPDIC